jgi:hypothetical protein
VIIRREVGVPGLKKVLLLLLFLLPTSLTWLSCGGSGSTPAPRTSGIAFRAFITNNVSAGTATAAVFIVNAETDVRPSVAPISAGNTPGMMVVTPNRAQTLVFSGGGLPSSDNQFTIINNAGESAAGHVILPGMTESFVVSPDSSTAYIAVPTAPVVDQSPGVVEVFSLNGGAVIGQVDVPSIHYLSIDNSGNRILGFSDNSDSVAVITPSNIGIPGAVVVTPVCCFARPVAAFFSSDDTTAYVVNCGAECGGTLASAQASVQILDLTTNTAGSAVSVPAATVALVVNSSTMYLAGTPVPPQSCPAGTAATSCGLLTTVNLSPPMSVTGSVTITDGYHTHIALGPNGQLFIGAHTCTEIIPPVPPPTGAETRGCLSIYNTLPATTVGSNPPGGVLVPPESGDVTGIQPIAKRGTGVAQEAVYVVQGQGVADQGGTLYIYDATTDALEYNPNDTSNPGQIFALVGNFFDVKTVDF